MIKCPFLSPITKEITNIKKFRPSTSVLIQYPNQASILVELLTFVEDRILLEDHCGCKGIKKHEIWNNRKSYSKARKMAS